MSEAGTAHKCAPQSEMIITAISPGAAGGMAPGPFHRLLRSPHILTSCLPLLTSAAAATSICSCSR